MVRIKHVKILVLLLGVLFLLSPGTVIAQCLNGSYTGGWDSWLGTQEVTFDRRGYDLSQYQTYTLRGGLCHSVRGMRFHGMDSENDWISGTICTVLDRIGTSMFNIYCALLDNMQQITGGVATLYIILYAISLVTGINNVNIRTTWPAFIKLIIVFMFTINPQWFFQLGYEVMLSVINGFSEVILNLLPQRNYFGDLLWDCPWDVVNKLTGGTNGGWGWTSGQPDPRCQIIFDCVDIRLKEDELQYIQREIPNATQRAYITSVQGNAANINNPYYHWGEWVEDHPCDGNAANACTPSTPVTTSCCALVNPDGSPANVAWLNTSSNPPSTDRMSISRAYYNRALHEPGFWDGIDINGDGLLDSNDIPPQGTDTNNDGIPDVGMYEPYLDCSTVGPAYVMEKGAPYDVNGNSIMEQILYQTAGGQAAPGPYMEDCAASKDPNCIPCGGNNQPPCTPCGPGCFHSYRIAWRRSSVFDSYDSLWTTMVGENFLQSVGAVIIALALSFFGFGLVMAALTLAGVIAAVMAFIRLMITFLTAMISLVFSMMFAPIFFLFLLFKSTESLFNRWLSVIISYALQPVLLMAFIFIMSDATDLASVTKGLANHGIKIVWVEHKLFSTKTYLNDFWDPSIEAPSFELIEEVDNTAVFPEAGYRWDRLNINTDLASKPYYAYVRKMAWKESGYNATVVNSFGYAGLFQFGEASLAGGLGIFPCTPSNNNSGPGNPSDPRCAVPCSRHPNNFNCFIQTRQPMTFEHATTVCASGPPGCNGWTGATVAGVAMTDLNAFLNTPDAQILQMYHYSRNMVKTITDTSSHGNCTAPNYDATNCPRWSKNTNYYVDPATGNPVTTWDSGCEQVFTSAGNPAIIYPAQLEPLGYLMVDENDQVIMRESWAGQAGGKATGTGPMKFSMGGLLAAMHGLGIGRIRNTWKVAKIDCRKRTIYIPPEDDGSITGASNLKNMAKFQCFNVMGFLYQSEGGAGPPQQIPGNQPVEANISVQCGDQIPEAWEIFRRVAGFTLAWMLVSMLTTAFLKTLPQMARDLSSWSKLSSEPVVGGGGANIRMLSGQTGGSPVERGRLQPGGHGTSSFYTMESMVSGAFDRAGEIQQKRRSKPGYRRSKIGEFTDHGVVGMIGSRARQYIRRRGVSGSVLDVSKEARKELVEKTRGRGGVLGRAIRNMRNRPESTRRRPLE